MSPRKPTPHPDPSKLLAHLPSAVVYIADGRVTWANEAAGRLLGRTIDELSGMPVEDLIAPRDAARAVDRLRGRHRGEGPPERYELDLRRADGTELHVQIHVQVIAPGEEIVTLENVSDRVREAALATGLSVLAGEVQRARTVDDVLRHAGEGVARLGIQFCAMRALNGELSMLRLEGAFDAESIERLAGRRLREMWAPLSDVAARVFATGRAEYLDDLLPLLRYFVQARATVDADKLEPLVLAQHAGKGVVCPMFVHGEPWGVLILASDTLDSNDAATVALFASQVASAIEVAEIIADLEKKNRDMEAVNALAGAGSGGQLERVLPQLLSISAAALKSERVAIFLSDPSESPAAVLVGAHGLPGASFERLYQPVVDELLASAEAVGEPVCLDGGGELASHGVGHQLLVPLQRQGRVCGVLLVARSSAPFLESDLVTARLLAHPISIEVENARLYTEAHRRVHQLSVLFAMSRIGTERRDEKSLVQGVLEELAAALSFDVCALFTIEHERMRMAGVHGTPADRGRIEELGAIQIDEATACGAAATALRTTVLDLALTPAEQGGIARPLGGRHVVASPLILDGRLTGVVWGMRRADRPFDPEELQLLESCAAQVAVALDGARLLESQRRRVNDLSVINEVGALVAGQLELSAVFKVGLRNLARIVDVANTFLLLADEQGRTLEVVASNLPTIPEAVRTIDINTPAAATTAMRERRPINIPDAGRSTRASARLIEAYGHTALLALPLIARDKVIGAVVLGQTEAGRGFSSEDEERAMAVANQIALAIANARLYEAERRRVEELRHLLEVSRVITASLDLKEALVGSARSLAKLVDASHSFIWLIDRDKDMIRGIATSAEEHLDHFSSVRLPLSAPTLAARAALTGLPQRTIDAFASRDVNPDLNARYRMKSLLALPLILRGEVMGSVTIGDMNRTREWTDAEVERATVVARQVAIAVANARLFDDLKRSYDELSRTQAELLKRERLAALGELSAVMAHEVRNPLGVIFNSLVSLRRVLKPSGDAAMLLDIVGEEADRLNRIVGDLLDFARPNEADLRVEQLEPLLHGAMEAVAAQASAANVNVRTEIDPAVASVPVDARMLRQALINLGLNAVQAMPRGGSLTIRARPEVNGARKIARIDVKDTGGGVPPSLADRIFQPFFTTKATGTGLGLAVVKRIVEAHQGEILVESSPGVGTTFSIRLPLEPRGLDVAAAT